MILDTPQPAARKFQFGLRAFLLFALVAGPVLAMTLKWFIGSRGPSHTVPTSGVVLHANGTPLVGASVSFAGTGRGFISSGFTDAAGNFALSTFEENDGAVPGNYSVTVSDQNGTLLLSAPATVNKAKNVFKIAVP